jgi:hypothetical protein
MADLPSTGLPPQSAPVKPLFSTEKHFPYYSAEQVSEHNISTDCWVSYFNKVYNLSSLVVNAPADLTAPILAFAGQDISHWFDASTFNPKTHFDPSTGIMQFYTPYGRYLDIPPTTPTARFATNCEIPWWRNEAAYMCGYLSSKSRMIRVVNILTGQSDSLRVCSEERLADIVQRYLSYNDHAASYTWKRLGRELDMQKTLDENGIIDEADELAELNLNNDEDHTPVIHIYFNDDLVAE